MRFFIRVRAMFFFNTFYIHCLLVFVFCQRSLIFRSVLNVGDSKIVREEVELFHEHIHE